ncbi:MAG: sulfatase-like hydrolase/transferase, partial [Pseudomonadota bacterium]
ACSEPAASSTMTRVSVIVRAVLLAAAILACTTGALAATPPNVLLIYVDDLGYGDLGSYGHPVIRTPVLDELASQGARLTQYYAPSALCSPSRAGLLTGRIPARTGIYSWIPPDSGIYLQTSEHTLAEMLREHGYETALVGKWHLNSGLGRTDEPQPQDHGFESFYGHNAYQIPTNRNPTNIYRNREALPEQPGYTAQLYVDEALAWLAGRASAQPFFLMLSMAEPHTTIENPPAWNAMYRSYTRGPIVPIPSGGTKPPWGKLTPRGPGEYYANISYMDAQLGRLLAWLRRSGKDRNTLVIFASDNGPVTSRWQAWHEVNAHGSTGGLRGRKHYLHEGGIRVPAIVRLPGVIEPGREVDTPITGLDWLPTIAALAGVAPAAEQQLDGDDVLPALTGRRLRERTLFWAMTGRSELRYAVRRGHWKLLLDAAGEPRELYDLKADHLELNNRLRDQPAQAARLRRHFEQIHRSLPTGAQAFEES